MQDYLKKSFFIEESLLLNNPNIQIRKNRVNNNNNNSNNNTNSNNNNTNNSKEENF